MDEVEHLRAQLAAVTKERDDLAAIVFGRIKGLSNGTLPNMGGQTRTQDDCTFCGTPCRPSEVTRLFGLRYCDHCVDTQDNTVLLTHARRIMQQGGSAAIHAPKVDKNNQPVGVIGKVANAIASLAPKPPAVAQAQAQRALAQRALAQRALAQYERDRAASLLGIGIKTDDRMPPNAVAMVSDREVVVATFNPNSTDTQVIKKSEWDEWLDALNAGKTP